MKDYINLLYVFIGAGFGGMFRYLLVYLISRIHTNFSFGIVSVNLIGCFAAGIFLFLIQQHSLSKNMTVLFVTGFLGGFTTFSAFSMETLIYLQRNQLMFAIYNVLLSLSSLFMTYIGYFLALRCF